MREEIATSLNSRFVPYLQLHEFEALLFNDLQLFYQQVPSQDLVGVEELEEIFLKYPNPEMINSRKETSPSHRVKENYSRL